MSVWKKMGKCRTEAGGCHRGKGVEMNPYETLKSGLAQAKAEGRAERFMENLSDEDHALLLQGEEPKGYVEVSRER